MPSAVAKWLRMQRLKWCGRTKRAPLLPTTQQQTRAGIKRVFLGSFFSVFVLVVLARVASEHASLQKRNARLESGGLEKGTAGGKMPQQNATTQTPTPSRCAGVTLSLDCGDLLVPEVLCRPTVNSHMRSRFTHLRTSPWTGSSRRRGNGGRSALRFMQYSWSAPTFGSGNSWHATRLQILAAALLSKSDIICLQGLASEQANWLKDALLKQGYNGILHAADLSLSPPPAPQALDPAAPAAEGADKASRHDAQQPHAEAQQRHLNVATFWLKKYALISSSTVLASGAEKRAEHAAGSEFLKNHSTISCPLFCSRQRDIYVSYILFITAVKNVALQCDAAGHACAGIR